MLKLLGLGVGFNPISVLIAVAIVFALGASSGAVVNGWRLGLQLANQKVDLVTMTGNAQICSDKLATQNAAVDVVGDLGVLITNANRLTIQAIERDSAARRGQIALLEAVLAKGAPTGPDGKPAGCDAAWREILKGRAKP